MRFSCNQYCPPYNETQYALKKACSVMRYAKFSSHPLRYSRPGTSSPRAHCVAQVFHVPIPAACLREWRPFRAAPFRSGAAVVEVADSSSRGHSPGTLGSTRCGGRPSQEGLGRGSSWAYFRREQPPLRVVGEEVEARGSDEHHAVLPSRRKLLVGISFRACCPGRRTSVIFTGGCSPPPGKS